MFGLIPQTKDILPDYELQRLPTNTYQLDYPRTQKIKGYIDGREAMEQAVYKILFTERYEYVIYDWNYGIELDDLFGKPIPYVYAELERRVDEALMQDDRIEEVLNFSFTRSNIDEVTMRFDVDTIFGVIPVEKVVNIRV